MAASPMAEAGSVRREPTLPVRGGNREVPVGRRDRTGDNSAVRTGTNAVVAERIRIRTDISDTSNERRFNLRRDR